MKITWLPIPVFSVAMTLLACSAPNARFCETSADCDPADECNLAMQTCVAAVAPDADVPQEPVAETCQNQCLPGAPLGWTGPMARSTAALGQAPAQCDGAFADEFALKSADIGVSNDCGCSCGTASGLSCSNATLREWTSDEASCELNTCPVVGGTCTENQISVGDGCEEVPSFMKDEAVLKGSMGQLAGGSCGAPTATGTTQSEFESQTRLCQSELTSTGCAQDEVCAPSPSAAFENGLCVVQEGDISCPEDSIYTERFVVFDGIDDQQSCDASSCSCSAPTGSCGGKIELRAGDEFTCGAVLATLSPATSIFGDDNFCAARPAGFARASYVTNLNNRSCSRTGEGSVSGQAIGTGATTICCSK